MTRRHSKLKVSARRTSLQRTVTSGSAASRNYPAWIDAGEGAVAFTATRTATPRVRAGLVLRAVKPQPARQKGRYGGRR